MIYYNKKIVILILFIIISTLFVFLKSVYLNSDENFNSVIFSSDNNILYAAKYGSIESKIFPKINSSNLHFTGNYSKITNSYDNLFVAALKQEWSGQKNVSRINVWKSEALHNNKNLLFFVIPEDNVKYYAWIPSYNYIALVTNDTLKIYDVINKKYIKNIFINDYIDFVNDVIASPDGRELAVVAVNTSGSWGNSPRRVLRWDTATWDPLPPIIPQDVAISRGAYSPDGRTLALTGTARGKPDTVAVWLYSVDTGALRRTWDAHRDSVNVIVFSPDGKHIATGSGFSASGSAPREGAARLWRVDDGALVQVLQPESPHFEHFDSIIQAFIGSPPVYDIKFTRDSRSVVLVAAGEPIRVVEVTTAATP